MFLAALRAVFPVVAAIMIIVWGMASCVSPAHARTDTLRHYDTRRGLFHFRDPEIVMHAARFEPPAPGYLTGITVALGGDSAYGEATLHIFGHEGGSSVPMLEHDLVPPIRIQKTRPGIQEITVMLPRPVLIGNNQMFVAVDGLTPGVLVMTGRQDLPPRCSTSLDHFGYQYLKFSDGSWKFAPYAYAITSVIEVEEEITAAHLTDMTAAVGLADSTRHVHGISWADIDADGYLDLLAAGRLYRNVGGKRFEDISDTSNLKGNPRAAVLLDADNDRLVDILFLGSLDSADPGSTLFLRTTEGSFTRHHLDIPLIEAPSGVAIADADGDGYLDAFVGQIPGPNRNRNYLLLNDRKGGFKDATSMLYADDEATEGSLGAQWVDYDNDGTLDLFIRTAEGGIRLLNNKGEGRFTSSSPVRRPDAVRSTPGIGCHWVDFDNDGDRDALLPGGISLDRARKGEGVAPVYVQDELPEESISPLIRSGLEYEELSAGGAWGDIDNDGLQDLIVTSGCDCRFADIYIQQPDHTFRLETVRYGMNNVPAGPDAIWLDYDNDGKLDLATTVDGRINLLRNQSPDNGRSYLQVDLEGADIVGARAVVHAGEVVYTREATAGRGMLMQDPLRLHFGLADAEKIDSLEIIWGNGSSETRYDIPVNRTLALREGDAREVLPDAAGALAVSPNPFQDNVSFRFRTARTATVSLTIHALDGTIVAALADGQLPAGDHEYLWGGSGEGGRAMPQGTYLYRFIADGKERGGKIVLIR